MKFAPTLAVTASLLAAGNVRAATSCPAAMSKNEAVQMQTRIFSALEREDQSAWDLLVAPDFLAFERGKPYAGAEFFGLIASAHRAGLKLSWSVTDPRVEADCNLVVMSYVNRGSIAVRGGDPKTERWLETVAVRKEAQGWRAFLVTSMAAANEAAKAP